MRAEFLRAVCVCVHARACSWLSLGLSLREWLELQLLFCLERWTFASADFCVSNSSRVDELRAEFQESKMPKKHDAKPTR